MTMISVTVWPWDELAPPFACNYLEASLSISGYYLIKMVRTPSSERILSIFRNSTGILKIVGGILKSLLRIPKESHPGPKRIFQKQSLENVSQNLIQIISRWKECHVYQAFRKWKWNESHSTSRPPKYVIRISRCWTTISKPISHILHNSWEISNN